MSHTLIILQKTFFKTKPLQASDPELAGQAFLVKPGDTFPIAAFKIEGNHIKFTLGKVDGVQQTVGGYNTLYAFIPHIQLSEPDGGTVLLAESHVTEEGIALIKEFEGLELESYLCPAGIPTIGYGSTLGVQLGMKITEKEADTRMRIDVLNAEQAVKKLLKVRVNSNQLSALVSFVYNVGINAFAESTLLKKINAGDFPGAAKEFDRWVKAGDKKLPGLVRRRKAEKDLFNKSL